MKNELEQLSNGLDSVQDNDNFEIPDAVKEQFAGYSLTDIRAQIAEAKALGAAALIRLGFAYMGLKQKLKGKFKETIIAEEGSTGYMNAWRAMCRAKAFLLLPEVAQQLGRRAVHKILSLSSDDILSLRAKLLAAPPELAKAITDDALDKFDEARLRNKHNRWAGNPKSQQKKQKPVVAPPPEHPDKQWVEIETRWAAAVVAMRYLVGACRSVKEWKSEYVDIALEKKMVIQLGDEWDEIVRFLHPIDEIRKRGMCEDE